MRCVLVVDDVAVAVVELRPLVAQSLAKALYALEADVDDELIDDLVNLAVADR